MRAGAEHAFALQASWVAYALAAHVGSACLRHGGQRGMGIGFAVSRKYIAQQGGSCDLSATAIYIDMPQ